MRLSFPLPPSRTTGNDDAADQVDKVQWVLPAIRETESAESLSWDESASKWASSPDDLSPTE